MWTSLINPDLQIAKKQESRRPKKGRKWQLQSSSHHSDRHNRVRSDLDLLNSYVAGGIQNTSWGTRQDQEVVLDRTESDLHLQLYFTSTLFYTNSPDSATEER